MARMGIITNGTAGADIPANRITKYGGADGTWLPAAAAADLLAGVSGEMAVLNGERVDICRSGIADVLYGGTVARGAKLTSDAQGRAIATTTTGDQIIGIAEVSGVVGDIGSVLIAPGVL